MGIGLTTSIWSYCRKLPAEEAPLVYTAAPQACARALGVSAEVARSIQRQLGGIDFKAEEARLARAGIDYLTPADAAYPKDFECLFHRPPALFFTGRLDLDLPRVAIVGTRKCTGYGQVMARQIASGLAAAGVTVVSGLALGIDGSAHEGALERGRTVAVLGSGLDEVYPKRHRRLAARAALAGGLVSEYPPGTPPRPHHFPARNRIISALSSVVVVVEAPSRSGALITVDFALEHGRDVFAVPGDARSRASAGCHELLRDGATPATSADDILDHLGVDPAPAGASAPAPPLSLSAAALLEQIGYSRARVETVVCESKRRPEEAMADIAKLEVDGFVVLEPGGWVTRIL